MKLSLKQNLKQHLQTLSLSHLKGKSTNFVLIIGIILALFSANIANIIYEKYQIEPWLFTINLLRFDFLLIIFALRTEVKKLISPLWYRIIVYILINNNVDRFFGITDWSWNDYLTIGIILLEYLIHKKMKNATR